MANTTELRQRTEGCLLQTLSAEYPGKIIKKDRVALSWGGQFEYDAVVYDGDHSIAVYCLSCSEYRTSSGAAGSGKLHKIRGDILMMLGTDCPRRVLVLAGRTMFQKVSSEREAGRLPGEIEIVPMDLPADVQRLVDRVRRESVREVSPQG